MRRILPGILLLSSIGLAAKTEVFERLDEAANVMAEIMATPDKGIPQDLLDKASCVVAVPGMKKAALGIGGTYGKGFITCRRAGEGWSAPAAMRIEGGSFGFQIGVSDTDVVMLVMNKNAVNKLLSSKFTLGAEGTVAAGPVGRSATAQTDAKMNAEILSWSRSKGLFAGIALTGATLRPDNDNNEELYGRKIRAREIVDSAKPPAETSKLLAVLNRHSPMEK
jgi:lipid-binding SYLF domain-containing protein